MNIIENIKNAFQVILLNKMRASLSMLGIIIGVASVIVLISIGQGTSQSILNRVQSLGSNLITISPGSTQSSNVRSMSSIGGGSSTNILTDDQVEAIKKQVDYISAISPEVRTSKQIIYGKDNTSATIYGVEPTYSTVHNFSVNYGQFISSDNVANNDKVAVLGVDVVDSLFSGENPIGKDIVIGNRIYTVIGVMEEKGSSGMSNQDNTVFVPVTTAQRAIIGNQYYQSISIAVSDADQMDYVKSAVTSVLMSSLGITNTDDINFTVQNQADMLSTISEISGTMTMFLGGIAGISLVVGGIGVMNIMLVSVTERTREIGLRKALGATKIAILSQFLIEALVLSLLGGLIGISISYGIILLIQKLNLMTVVLSVNSVILSSGFSLGIGVVFGLLPAYKAGNLKVIDALRFE